MSEYKDSINLPQTAFPMKANLAEREPQMLKHWQELELYQKIQQQRQNHPKFILHDGPPYANGQLHIGHAVNKVLKDIVVKSRLMSGFNAPFVPGWDCHGLPIEHVIEKKQGKVGQKVSAEAFRAACRAYATEQIQQQRSDFMRLGVLGDWEHPYLTMAPAYEANIIRAFSKIVANGHLIKGHKPVHWCIDCNSALAEAEVEYKDKSSIAIDVRFEVLDEEILLSRCHHNPDHAGLGEGKLSIPIWTTTPWTLPANQAVAVNPNLEYAVVQVAHERLVIAEGLLQDTLKRYDITDYRVIAYCRGDALEGIKLKHPFYAKEVPVICGHHVTTDAGTGAVHTAPGHGIDDYAVGMEYKLEVLNPVDGKGVFVADTPDVGGLHINAANKQIIEILKTKGTLIHEQRIEHSYPHCWRHKTPLIFRATPQWFISMDNKGLRQGAVTAIYKVQWIPETGRTRIATMVEGRPDWCISRQRSWGVPIPLFIHKDSGDLHPDTVSLMEKVATLVAKDGIEAWFQLEPQSLLGADSADYEKVKDVLDVWFDSGVSHFCVLKQDTQLAYPADIYLEGSDQHRGWFQSSLLTAIALGQEVPYKKVLTHGFTVDGQGRKMSKSLGNVISIEQAAKTLGVDILRLWIASTDYSGELSYSDEIWKRTADTYRRLRNTARYLLANLYDYDPKQNQIPYDQMLALDQWAVTKASLLQEEVKKAYEEFQFLQIYQKVHHFCSIEMGSFYLDVIKDRQYTTQKNSLPRRSAQTAMFHIAEGLVRWLAPILSFTADEIWKYLPGEREPSVFLSTWYEGFPALYQDDTFSLDYWQQMIKIRDCVNKELERQRNEGHIGAPLEAEVTLYCNPEVSQLLTKLATELRFVFITSAAEVKKIADAPDAAVATEINGLKILVQASKYEKCVRCWHRRADVGKSADHPQLCERCVTNVIGEGEQRLYV